MKMITGTERERNKTKGWNEWKDDRKDERKTMEKERRKKRNCFEDSIGNIEMRRKKEVFNMLLHRPFSLSQFLCDLFARTAAFK
ncbi:hypothetical protein B7P43_G13941 [Cryptotermes secundus]|uniref:Uncharacterized protein n=1 Tax=Cryptotermes secundus TaxID=105785 RepID=A0A2J7Q8D0_9NEOP|nr:hypothetical protein B7P43_G13941 [Cryptotermes secundus]